MFFFKNGIFFLNCTDRTDFLKNVRIFEKMYGLVKKMYGLVKKKIVRIVRFFFRKLYGFLLKMYGFFYGLVQKSFGHPEYIFYSESQIYEYIAIVF